MTTLQEFITAFTNTSFSYAGITSVVSGCKENKHNIIVDKDGNTLVIRRWSYHRKR